MPIKEGIPLFDTMSLRHKFPLVDQLGTERTTLIVGDLLRWNDTGRRTDAFDRFQFTSYAGLTVDTFSDADPAMILSPLSGDDFDAIDLAGKLHDLGFHGFYRAISMEQVSVAIVCAEVQQCAPGLDFDVLIIPDAISSAGS